MMTATLSARQQLEDTQQNKTCSQKDTYETPQGTRVHHSSKVAQVQCSFMTVYTIQQ